MTVLSKSAHRAIMQVICILVLPLILIACSGGETGTGMDVTQTESTITVGRITDVDNDTIHVNGIEFDIDDSSISIDNESASDDDLEPGMIVEIEATISEDGLTADAIHVDYQDILEAYLEEDQLDEDDTGTLIIAGQSINIDSSTVFDSQVDSISNIREIQTNNIIEVSGFTSGNGNINATRIDVKAEEYFNEDTIEIKGRVAATKSNTFKIGKLVINHTTADLINFPAEGISNGQYIEVTSITGLNDENELIANTLTLLNRIPGQSSRPPTGSVTQTHIEGLVTSVITAGEEFTLNGQTVIITESTTFAAAATADDITENQTITVIGFISEEGVITAIMIRLF